MAPSTQPGLLVYAVALVLYWIAFSSPPSTFSPGRHVLGLILVSYDITLRLKRASNVEDVEVSGIGRLWLLRVVGTDTSSRMSGGTAAAASPY
ncbi:hypothetical protein EJ04DRAFT_571331 [Polyplosphaeria fusca]|uniref:Uncharacterized protein n=1 Tax=Polyplosphaeria fusca TaxID=682080 RepID=A0A9P4QHI7_9PLEO|nr:hypothetical protein EJ04DRAFT_571331 [Polyplosphaeria fusca]